MRAAYNAALCFLENSMKSSWLLPALLAALTPAFAAGNDSLQTDARARLDYIRRVAPALAQGGRLVNVSAALQENGSTVLELVCEQPETDGRTLVQWSGALLREGQVQIPARLLAQLTLGLDGKQDATVYFNTADGDYRHARTLGCYLGLLQNGLQAAGDVAAQRMALTKLLHETAKQAGVADVNAVSDETRAGARWVQARLKASLQDDSPVTTRLSALAPAESEADAAALTAFRQGLSQGGAVR